MQGSDVLILKALSTERNYKSLHAAVPVGALSGPAQALLAWYPVYFKRFQQHEAIDWDAFLGMVVLESSAGKEQEAVLKRMVQQVKGVTDEVSTSGVLESLMTRALVGKAGAILEAYNAGEEIDAVEQLHTLARETRTRLAQTVDVAFIDDPIGDLLEREGVDDGINLPTQVLKDHVKGLLGGATIALGARPDAGKTSFLSAIAVEAAQQIPRVFGSQRPVLWLNNEGDGRRIVPRLYQAALNYTFPELVQASKEGRLVREYTEVVGDVHAIRVMDMHSASLAQIEQVIERTRPAMVMYDMLANFRYDGERAGGNKTDGIEQRWQQVRTMAVEYDHIGIGTIQVSADGDNMLFPPMSALKDSKTGVQGATDVIILLGKLNDPNMNGLRGISTPKNKFQMPGRPGHIQSEIAFDPERCQFPEIGEVS